MNLKLSDRRKRVCLILPNSGVNHGILLPPCSLWRISLQGKHMFRL
ncbi:unnamed protein product [Tenebrio molitor]|nr:unnamed protein product [Tenebrio molitor]